MHTEMGIGWCYQLLIVIRLSYLKIVLERISKCNTVFYPLKQFL
jgi:hypothetical protein